jgi:hypothetical protein
LLENARNIRHAVVHNGGRVSEKFKQRIKSKSFVMGQIIPITFDYLEDVLSVSQVLASELFVAVSEKYFEIDGSNINTNVWRAIDDTK